MRILYFDIDGVLLNYDDSPKSKLLKGVLQKLLIELNFEKLVCVSGWSDIVNDKSLRKNDSEKHDYIYKLLEDIFIESYFKSKLELILDTDNRCRRIDLTEDWYYIDDWADEYFVKEFGDEMYNYFLGHRILLVNPHGDGSDIINWLNYIKMK